MLTVSISKDEVTPDLRRLLELASRDGGLATVMGRAGANVLRRHFRDRNGTPNRLGGQRTNFWNSVAESVHSPRSKGGKIVIPINHPAIAQKVFGRPITAKKAKNLAIPVHPAAHGKSPRVFDSLTYAMNDEGVKMLGMVESDGVFRAYYLLRRSVDQRPDKDALPKDDIMVAAITKAAAIRLRRRE